MAPSLSPHPLQAREGTRGGSTRNCFPLLHLKTGRVPALRIPPGETPRTQPGSPGSRSSLRERLPARPSPARPAPRGLSPARASPRGDSSAVTQPSPAPPAPTGTPRLARDPGAVLGELRERGDGQDPAILPTGVPVPPPGLGVGVFGGPAALADSRPSPFPVENPQEEPELAVRALCQLRGRRGAPGTRPCPTRGSRGALSPSRVGSERDEGQELGSWMPPPRARDPRGHTEGPLVTVVAAVAATPLPVGAGRSR